MLAIQSFTILFLVNLALVSLSILRTENIYENTEELISGNSNSEIAHVSFVTELRHKRDLSQNEYHIVEENSLVGTGNLT